jgi:hypothetical protein
VIYDYEYELSPPGASEEDRAAVARRNVSRSLEMDPLRVEIGPTSERLRRRVLEEAATRNGRASL